MKIKLYIEKLLKWAIGVCGGVVVALASSLAVAGDGSLTEQLEAQEAARVADEASSSIGGPGGGPGRGLGRVGAFQIAREESNILGIAIAELKSGREHPFFEALGESGSLSNVAPNEESGLGVESKTLGLKLSESLWKSSEVASEHSASEFMMDKIGVFNNENTDKLKFAKEDYFDDFREKHEKNTEDKVAQAIINETRETKIERIASAAERREGRRAEKVEKSEEKAAVKAEKAEAKAEKKAKKDAEKDDKKDKDDDDDGGKKGK